MTNEQAWNTIHKWVARFDGPARIECKIGRGGSRLVRILTGHPSVAQVDRWGWRTVRELAEVIRG